MTLTTPSHPPMGWNCWDWCGTTVTEGEVLANARFIAANDEMVLGVYRLVS